MAKPFDIQKKLVWEAYLRVKAAGGAPGVDGQTIEELESDLKSNLYRIWNRMSSGTYFAPPVLRVAIPKRNGGTRNLGIPTVSDRIARQTVVKMVLEPAVEPLFHSDSYGYRPGKSAVQAVGQARVRCWKFNWVLDLDIRSFFDSLDHELVLRAVKKYTASRWVILYIERWLKAPVQTQDGLLEPRTSGTPQGGVVSPLLANIFLHLAFDTWMKESFAGVPFERYADDVIVHCRTKQQAEAVLLAVQQRLARCRLELHPQKTKIVYCKDSNRTGDAGETKFDFLGFTFRPRRARNRQGEYFASFSPAISGWRRRRSGRRCGGTGRYAVERTRAWPTWRHVQPGVARLDPVLRSYCRSALNPVFRPLDRALAKWARRKFKRLRGHQRRARRWLEGIARRDRQLFAHWYLLPRGRTAG